MQIFLAMGRSIWALIVIMLILTAIYFVDLDRVKSDREADELDARLREIEREYNQKRRNK